MAILSGLLMAAVGLFADSFVDQALAVIGLYAITLLAPPLTDG